MTDHEIIYLLTQIKKILLNSNSWNENTHEPITEAFDKAIEAFKEHRWIPVTERLPEDEVDVLIYTTDKKINKAYHRYKSWTENQKEWLVFETLGYGYIYNDDEVLAWMPLPKPYERSEEE